MCLGWVDVFRAGGHFRGGWAPQKSPHSRVGAGTPYTGGAQRVPGRTGALVRAWLRRTCQCAGCVPAVLRCAQAAKSPFTRLEGVSAPELLPARLPCCPPAASACPASVYLAAEAEEGSIPLAPDLFLGDFTPRPSPGCAAIRRSPVPESRTGRGGPGRTWWVLGVWDPDGGRLSGGASSGRMVLCSSWHGGGDGLWAPQNPHGRVAGKVCGVR